ncbi:HNH endonuclease family protein [Gordonia polyisoprenivorans]|uniref:HNH endonuclease family protein n=1 Tax=Gordonia polyisoprenivorans TaxID=84595 RepID=UPI0005BE6258|nr:HNH endonuclease family protein [Gordonia polyisoprenivorans]MBE7193917.1 HNH endonuclease [Gordonia polyisoprenivorans]OZC32931.1 HNH endonuclease [Gordonia polyisoprenivorans]UZF56338.1 HNH endonuclease family protein [Gordonia polyisoprenivorans]
MRRGRLALGASVVAVAAIAGCAAPGNPVTVTSPGANAMNDTASSSATSSPSVGTTAPSTLSPEAALAWSQLQALPVKGRAPKTGYSRAQFGQAWSDDVNVDDGHNGCDTRNDILRRDLIDIVLKPGTRGCVVLSGTLHDPYTDKTLGFTRGAATSSSVQIDHVVALSDAWQKGAQQLTPQQRVDFANDPRNLQATDGPTNQKKRDGDAATWLPPNRAYRCTYASRQIAVKTAYHLWVTSAERDALARILGTCSAQP